MENIISISLIASLQNEKKKFYKKNHLKLVRRNTHFSDKDRNIPN